MLPSKSFGRCDGCCRLGINFEFFSLLISTLSWEVDLDDSFVDTIWENQLMIFSYTCGVIEMLNDTFSGRAFDNQ